MVEWRVVPSFPWLEASSEGRIRRCLDSADGRRRAGKEIPGSKNNSGYLSLTIQFGAIRKCNYGKHILICEAFHGPRPSPAHEVAHNDGTRINNVPSNLRWATPKENAFDRGKHGTQARGTDHPMAILSEADILAIRHLKCLGYSNRDVAVLVGMHPGTITKLATSKNWSTTFRDGAANATLSFGG